MVEMSDINDDIDEHDDDEVGNGHDHHGPVDEIDLFGAAIALCQVAQRAKTVEAALKRLRKIGRDTLAAEQKLAAIEARAADTATALAEREAAIAARELAFDERQAAFETSCKDVRDEFREYHGHLDDLHRLLVHRVAATAGIMWNETLQEPPSWQQLRQRIPDLPSDPPLEREVAHPRIDISDTFADPLADRHGQAFLGSLSRSVEHKRGAT
jgi:hypothetical protein